MAKLRRSFALTLVVMLVLTVVMPVFAVGRENAGAETILLLPQDADFSGAPDIVVEPDQPPYNIGGWVAGNTVSWDITVQEAGFYTLHIEYARPGDYPTATGNIRVEGQGEDSTLRFEAQPTGRVGGNDDWSVYTVNSGCGIRLEPGEYKLSVWPDRNGNNPPHFINLRGITLEREGQEQTAASGADPEAESKTAGYGVAEGSGQVHDYAGIFTDTEEAELRDAAETYAANLGVHLVILTVDDASKDVLEDYSRDFYETNIAGVDGIFDCAMMTVNMGTRRVANDFYGELRTMVSDWEASVIREGYSADLTEGNYVRAARYFLDESARLVGAKLEEYRIDVPEADPSELVYDYAGVLMEDEYTQLVTGIQALSEATGIPHFIVITGEHGGEDYLKRYASSFYKRNLQDIGGCLILTVSWDAMCAVSPFGSYMPENSLLWEMTDEVNTRLVGRSVYAGCQYFLSKQTDEWQAENFRMPEVNPTQIVYDFTDCLTDEEEESLRREIDAVSGKYGVDLYIVMSDISSPKTMDAFERGFTTLMKGNWYKDGFVALLVGAAPEIEGENREIRIARYGRKAYRKIGYNQSWTLRWTADSLMKDGDAYGACRDFIGGTAEDLSSIIPNVNMVDNIGWALGWSVLLALVLPGLTILVLRILHGFKGARKVPARTYLVSGSVALSYSRDVFIGSHTTKTKIQRESSSGGGGSGGSSGGGISSRSEGGF